MKILYLEDNLDLANSMINGFEKIFGFNKDDITWFTSVEQALEACVPGKYDLVVTDSNLLGKLRGEDLIRIIKKQEPNLRCVLMSGNFSRVEAKGMKQDFVIDRYISKDSDTFEELEEEIIKVRSQMEQELLS
jgi:DNA-binding NtrC family response regulator